MIRSVFMRDSGNTEGWTGRDKVLKTEQEANQLGVIKDMNPQSVESLGLTMLITQETVRLPTK